MFVWSGLAHYTRGMKIRRCWPLLVLLFLVGCWNSKHQIRQVGDVYVGLNVPKEWEIYRGADAWRMPGADRFHLQITRTAGDPARVLLQELELVKDGVSDGKVVWTAERFWKAADAARHWAERRGKQSSSAGLFELKSMAKEINDLQKQVREGPPFSAKFLVPKIERWQEQVRQWEGDEQQILADRVSQANYFISFAPGQLKSEQRLVGDLPAVLVDVPTGKDPYKFVFIEQPEGYLVIEFHDFYEGKVFAEVEGILESFQYGVTREDVLGSTGQALSVLPALDHKQRRWLFFLGLYLFCTVLPAGFKTFLLYPKARLEGSFGKSLRVQVRGAVMKTTATVLTLLVGLLATALVWDLMSGHRFRWGNLFILVFLVFISFLLFALSIGAGHVAGLAARWGFARNSRGLSALAAAGGAFLGGLAFGLLAMMGAGMSGGDEED